MQLKISHTLVGPLRLLAYGLCIGIAGMGALGKIPKEQVPYYSHFVVAALGMFGVSFTVPEVKP